ncbi:unnamed protein product [Trichogramma brassicae]|uniref:Uncharacterized protein n=1 Tax=Trichogramma brassicae TaxID=86971 RepID=A0A6H5IB92_9HYME|nr:unnamed protein product [Trichogramma brassicae]
MKPPEQESVLKNQRGCYVAILHYYVAFHVNSPSAARRGSRPGFTRSEHHVTLVTNQVEILYFWTISSRKVDRVLPVQSTPRHASHNQVEILYFWTISSRKSTGFLPVQSTQFNGPHIVHECTRLNSEFL